MVSQAKQFVVEAYEKGISDFKGLQGLKKKYASRFKRSPFANTELVKAYRELIKEARIPDDKEFWKAIRKRGVRSHSGIANITVITKGYSCPGKCIYCPSEPGMPKSYLSNEPAVMRAILNDFDPYRQTLNRLDGLQKTGHITDKVDVIVSGGTWSSYPKEYQDSFTKGIYDALNHPSPPAESLEESQKINETAANRCIGLSFETRPDLINEEELINLRRLGCTKIEIGVQSLNDEVLKKNRRGHGVNETKRAIQLIKDAGFKVNCHMMPNLYGSNPENDFNDFKELFNNPAYRPDWLKIYPCVVVQWSELEKINAAGRYRSYSDEELVELLIRSKQLVPEYCRITRLIRDIPSNSIIAGSKVSNLRQVVQKKMEEKGLKCRCIRCRQVRGEKVYVNDVKMNIREFEASGGKEFFITLDEIKKDRLCALLRLRFHSYGLNGEKHFIKELEGASIIREVHTYGEQVAVSGKSKGASQHIGFGKQMIAKAEEISRENGFRKIAVISGIGVREYYRRLEYGLEGTYMVKYL
jgi:elongator complex protein 3